MAGVPLAIMVLLGLLTLGPHLARTRRSRPDRVRPTNGKQLIGTDGKPLLLRGINLGNWFVNEGYMFRFENGPQSARELDALFRDLAGPDAADQFWRTWRDTYISREDINLIRSAGFNSVRIPLHHALFI